MILVLVLKIVIFLETVLNKKDKSKNQNQSRTSGKFILQFLIRLSMNKYLLIITVHNLHNTVVFVNIIFKREDIYFMFM